jgi:CRP-like cAMP-binding protein
MPSTFKQGLINQQEEAAFALLRENFAQWQVPRELLDDLVERQTGISFEKGAMVFCEGTVDGLFACVISGYVKVYCPVGEGSRTLVRLSGPGDVIGYPAYIDEKGRQARLFEAQALTKCTLALFSRERILKLFENLPNESLVHILEMMNTFWSQNLYLFVTLLTLPLSDRLKIVMTDIARRAGVKDAQGTVLIPILGHEEFAEMIGCSRPMVSRLISDMEATGLIARRGKQYVLLSRWDFGCLDLFDRSGRVINRRDSNSAPALDARRTLGLPSLPTVQGAMR